MLFPLPTISPVVCQLCPHCEEGLQWRSRHGGNDPDVWKETCPYCHGTGEAPPASCDGLVRSRTRPGNLRRCQRWATKILTWPAGEVEYYCDSCTIKVIQDVIQ